MLKHNSLENCLVFLNENIELKKQDKYLIRSLAKQVLMDVGLTDKQVNLARKKLDEYQSDLDRFDIDTQHAKQNIDLPIRYLDRSRWIRFENSDEGIKICVRFLYAKKLINALENVKKYIPTDQADYDAESKTWRFDYSESNLYEIVKAFEKYNFEIHQDVRQLYEQLCELNPNDVVPGVYQGTIKNIPDNAVQFLKQEIGEVDQNHNLVLYKDRSIKYGLHYFDSDILANSLGHYSYLAGKIANRTVPNISIDNSVFSIESIVLALEELHRLPLLIVIPSQQPEIIVELHKSLKNIILPQDTSVMFRLDNTQEGRPLNDWIKDMDLNNPLDETTKIVYTLDNRIPKPVLNSVWHPGTILSVAQSSMLVSTKRILNYYADRDLIVHFENSNGEIIRSGYFEMERIE